jgi:hypothetical protein
MAVCWWLRVQAAALTSHTRTSALLSGEARFTRGSACEQDRRYAFISKSNRVIYIYLLSLQIPYTLFENHRSHDNLSSHHQTTLRVPKNRPQHVYMDAILLSFAKRRENTPHCDIFLERRCGQTHRQIHRCVPENVSLVTHTPRSLFHSRHVPQDQGICTAAEASYGLGARARQERRRDSCAQLLKRRSQSNQ